MGGQLRPKFPVDAIIQNGDKLGLDLDLSSSKVNIELNNFSGKAEKSRVKGTMNNGGIPVYMRASGGNVNVKFEIKKTVPSVLTQRERFTFYDDY